MGLGPREDERSSTAVTSVGELHDLLGFRIILLFSKDVDEICAALDANFDVIEREDKQTSLKVGEFGYLSVHYVVALRPDWLAIPVWSKYTGLRAEIQVRTVAQHVWAATSHVLQYKHEEDIAPESRRSLLRIAALLELIDEEYMRILRQKARATTKQLNVDTLERLLDKKLPAPNKDDLEQYADLLRDLIHFGITTPRRLTSLLGRHMEAILTEDKQTVEAIRSDDTLQQLHINDKDRLDRGVYFSHVGLVGAALGSEFGEAWEAYLAQKESGQEE